MSTALPIAATTRVLSLCNPPGDPECGIRHSWPLRHPRVNALHDLQGPHQPETGNGEVAQLSLFLSHAPYHQGWREVGLPSRNGSGAGIDRPPLALDLHDPLIAYGHSEYVPQILLGLGMQALDETPFLYRQQIIDVFTPGPAHPIDITLATANLADQIEMIKERPSLSPSRTSPSSGPPSAASSAPHRGSRRRSY